MAWFIGLDLPLVPQSVKLMGVEVGLGPNWNALLLPVAAVAIVLILRFHHQYQTATQQVESQQTRVEEVEQQAEAEADFPTAFKAQLRLVAERARLLMVKAEARANMLYGVGTTLTVISVFAPVASIAVYVGLDPLPQSVLEALQSLRGENGELPTGISVSVAKDWRVLLSGISFGFLFLAAAAALFTQHRRQMETFFILAKDVDYFNAVVTAVEIRARSDSDSVTLSSQMESLVNQVIGQLMRRPYIREQEPESKDGVVPAIKQLNDLMKQLKS